MPLGHSGEHDNLQFARFVIPVKTGIHAERQLSFFHLLKQR